MDRQDEAKTTVRRLRSHPELREMVADDPALLRDLLRPFDVDDENLEAMLRSARAETN